MPKITSIAAQQLGCFSPDYQTAQQHFTQLVNNTKQLYDQQTFHVENTRCQVALTTHAVWIGSPIANKVVIIISGTHGVEGFAGAAVQNDLLSRLQHDYSVPEEVAILLVFALNPYGFSHLRRCDGEGVDLNRNFVDFDKPLPENSGYRQLQAAIFTADSSTRNQLFIDYQSQYGQKAYEVAVSGGQYCDPYGPFYGGEKPAHGRKVIESIIQQYQLAKRKLAVIDIHTGLGSYAHGEVINDHPIDSHGFHTAIQWYGASVTSPIAGNSSSVEKLGLLDYAWHKHMQQQGCFITLEFGSYPTDALFEVILQDHRSWKSGDAIAKQHSGKAMLEHFCPADIYWRELILVKSRQVIQQAITGLQHG